MRSAETISTKFWLPEHKGVRHEVLDRWVKAVRHDQRHFQKRDLLHAILYGNASMAGLGPGQYARPVDDGDRLRINIIKPKVDTYQSMICRARPRAMYLTEGGNWDMRRRARGLDKWTQAKFRDSEIYDTVGPLCALDSAVFDFGVAHVFIENEKELAADSKYPERLDVRVERVHPWEMLFDDADAHSGNPSVIHRQKWVEREKLKALYPGNDAEIEDADDGDGDSATGGRDWTCDQVLVTESYRLPFGDKAGLRVVWLPNVTLGEAPFEFKEFPFPFLHRTPPPVGMRAQPLVEELRHAQIFANQSLRDFVDNVRLFGRLKWLVDRRGRVLSDQIDDDVGSQIEYDQFPPTPITPQTISADYYKFFWDVVGWTDGGVGLSAARTSGTVPTNLKSGVAIELNNDVQDGRFLVPSRLYERFFLKIAQRMVECGRIIAQRYPQYTARFSHKTQTQVVEFLKVDLKDTEYVMATYPVSALASNPSQRIDQLQELFDREAIDLATFRHLLDFPDLESDLTRLNAGRELSEKLIERYLEADDTHKLGLFIRPEPGWPLDQMKELFLMAVADAQVQGAPMENVELLREFIDGIDEIFAASKVDNDNAGPEGAPGSPDGAPPGAGGPIGPPPPPGGGGPPPGAELAA